MKSSRVAVLICAATVLVSSVAQGATLLVSYTNYETQKYCKDGREYGPEEWIMKGYPFSETYGETFLGESWQDVYDQCVAWADTYDT